MNKLEELAKLDSRLFNNTISQEEYDAEYKRIDPDDILYPVNHTTDTYKWTKEELKRIKEIDK
jgi:hypothetical protein